MDITKFKENDIPFSWNELKLGRFGFLDRDFYLQPIWNDEVVMKYILAYLTKNENEENPYLWELGSLFKPYDENEIFRLLDLVDESSENDLKSYYRWRWVLVNDLLNSIMDKGYVDALLEISEFWLDLKSPVDMPFQFQGVENQLTPQEFYTEEYLSKVVLSHKNWLAAEKERVR
ncbi:DUF2247 family protein [Listeria monocytogenes]|uniref:DUF2247 family protein n=1 Tax=Listeria monocytogenes TaxID=1639 RepID=UPI0008738B2B|nr:DUF2247 family protein [Listeria monocytogenes]EAD0700145.1 DUF2247 family protein [Listeria monocytogenes]EAD1460953.1 DUF2247 family protein [Listeria monocytogenes]EAD2807210.1 DUF2247 family protein [Listeria monocytogenes]EAD3583761.1 DUF2247 family protein [Listeria monocytogenes]EAD9908675.1 DUF2247 family protein [Listeria monocytogenes]